MSGRVVHLEDPAHRGVDALLPWYVNGTLADEERLHVETHLAECVRCQRELEWQRALQTACAEPVGDDDVDASLGRLRQRLDDGIGRRALAWLGHLRDGWQRAPAWTRWALAAQLVVCVALAGVLISIRAPALYHTLGTGSIPASTGARLVVVFNPSISEGRLNELLQESGARIVDGPTDTGAYVLTVPPARAARALAMLRKDRGVRIAEDLAPAAH